MDRWLDKYLEKLPFAQYTTKLSASIIYSIIASIAMNFFYQPGHIYSSGIGGIAQILTTLSKHLFGVYLPVSYTFYLVNLPLFFLAWFALGHRFMIFTVITVSLTSLMMLVIPETTLIKDPIICAIFGGAIMGAGIGFALRNGISSGGLDIISLTIRRKTGKTVGSISMVFNVFIMFAAGLLFGWPYMFYSAIAIFVSGKVTDVIYIKQKKIQVMIVTKQPRRVIQGIQERLQRGITIIHNAEGAHDHDPQAILLTVVTRDELPMLVQAMHLTDPKAFVSISENVQILGHFYEHEIE
ncbi:YitT family protein [Enterococcus hirae]|nr:YitT family protein [Enterococcus hirae]